MSDHRGPSPRAVTFVAVSATIVALATIAVILRFIARLRRPKPAGIRADDCLIVVSLLLGYGLLILAVLWEKYSGIGWPTATLSLEELVYFQQIFFADQITYSLICPVTKISILLTYRRIFHTRGFRLATLPVGGIVIAWGIAVLLVAIFQCSPVESFWDSALKHTCIDEQTFFWGNSISNLLTDVIILCLPMPMVWRLKLSRKRKIGVSCIFLLGSFVCVASILRIVSLGVIEDDDVSYTLPRPAMWSTIEPCIGIISACLPTLPRLFRRYQGKDGSSGFDSSNAKTTRLSHNDDLDGEKNDSRESFDNIKKPQPVRLEMDWPGRVHGPRVVNEANAERALDCAETSDRGITVTREVSIYQENSH